MACEVSLFAAQTLRQKVRQELGSLDEHNIAVLRQRLLQCIIVASKGPMQTLAQLCVAMASLITQRELLTSGAEALQSLGRHPQLIPPMAR